MGIGGGGWGIGYWGLGIGPNPQSPIPNPQSPIPNPHEIFSIIILIWKLYLFFLTIVNLLNLEKNGHGIFK